MGQIKKKRFFAIFLNEFFGLGSQTIREVFFWLGLFEPGHGIALAIPKRGHVATRSSCGITRHIGLEPLISWQ